MVYVDLAPSSEVLDAARLVLTVFAIPFIACLLSRLAR